MNDLGVTELSTEINPSSQVADGFLNKISRVKSRVVTFLERGYETDEKRIRAGEFSTSLLLLTTGVLGQYGSDEEAFKKGLATGALMLLTHLKTEAMLRKKDSLT